MILPRPSWILYIPLALLLFFIAIVLLTQAAQPPVTEVFPENITSSIDARDTVPASRTASAIDGAVPEATNERSSFSSQETYTSVVLLDIPWGSESNHVGLFEPKALDAGPNQVPQSFDVDKDGNVVILDSVNGRVVRYNSSSKFLGSFPVDARDDIRIAPDGSLYLLGYGEEVVLHYSLRIDTL